MTIVADDVATSEVWPGEPLPLGVTVAPDGSGANVAVVSTPAHSVELCLFDDHDRERRLPLPDRHGNVWHGFVPGLGAGQRYGFRVHGPMDPARGWWCNPAKLLLDPYARRIEGPLRPHASLRADRPGDSAPYVPRCVVDLDGTTPFDWGDDAPPRHHMTDSVIYEVHVKGATMRHPGVPEALRGTYAGMAHPAFVEHLVDLGVTAVELLPIHQHIDDAFLQARGLRNYWGYQTIGFFAPHDTYATAPGRQVIEMKQLVRAMHQAGIEVILDVVYNHTGEGDPMGGPTLCWRGLDNSSYHLDPADPSRYVDYTGTGNSLNVGNTDVLHLVMDSLRFWLTEFRVDGFRFDLASVLARDTGPVDHLAAFFDLIHQDPVLNRVKLIAEPWDAAGDYSVGRFPHRWAEWNGRYRDTVRSFWRGDANQTADLATRLAGSSDLYSDDCRHPSASVNFVTAHDGFTLADLTTYERKRNEANGDDNRDGSDDNRGWNCGVEGPTEDPDVLALRARQRRNLVTTLLMSQGAPMLLGGDEMGQTQGGNNNAYCQDNEISWLDWTSVDDDLLSFTRRLIALRRAHPVLRRRRFLTGVSPGDGRRPDVSWWTPDGRPMGHEWGDASLRTVVMVLDGRAITERSPRGERIEDGVIAVVLHAGPADLEVTVPVAAADGPWTIEIDTSQTLGDRTVAPGERLPIPGHSALVLSSRT
jgi:isoamylase